MGGKGGRQTLKGTIQVTFGRIARQGKEEKFEKKAKEGKLNLGSGKATIVISFAE